MMKRRMIALRVAFATMLMLAFASAQAWADYDARRSEALDTLAKAKLPPEEEIALKAAIEEYSRLRETCLKDLLRVVERDSLSDLKQGEEWTKRADTCKSETTRPISNAIQKMKDPSIGALGFATIFTIDEGEFYSAIQKFSVATQRDRIVAINGRMGDMTRVLDEKWSSITSQDASIDDRAKQTAAEINDILKEAIDSTANRKTTAREKMTKVVEVGGKYEWPDSGVPLLDAIKNVISVLQPFSETYNAMDTRVQERIRRINDYVRGESGLLIIFADQRAVVAEFLRDNGYPSAEEALRTAKAAFNTLVGAMKTSAQKTDGDRFGNDALNHLNNHMNRLQSTYGTFISHHQEKFFGPVSSKIEEELVELPFWDNWERAAFGLGLDTKLRDWQNDAAGYFGVSTSGLEPAEREYIREQLAKDLDTLHKSMEAAKRGVDPRKLHDQIDRAQLIRILKK
jgi:hypothetical protein